MWKPRVSWVLGCASRGCEVFPGGAQMESELGEQRCQVLGLVSQEGSGTSLCLSQGGSALLSTHLVR